MGERAGSLNKVMVDYLNQSFHLSTHLSALARVFFMAAGKQGSPVCRRALACWHRLA